jgi:nicotinic acid mononucleotide adenylyltransferase
VVEQSDEQPRIGVYPGTFDPATVAHVHLAEQAIAQLGLARVDLTISTTTLGKDDDGLTPIEVRLTQLHALTEGRPELGVRSSSKSLLADLSEGYDVVVVGADKWHQLLDPDWYGGVEARDEALRRLPVVAIAARPPWTLPDEDPAAASPEGVTVVVLETDPSHHPVSATEVRAGRNDWRASPRL